jgi:cell division protein FtsI (penicillin-binding protein 3)
MTYPSLRTPLRPLSRILPARERGENTDVIERENIRARHEAEKEAVRQRAQGRLLVLGIVFICLYSVIAIRVGTLSSSEPVEPRAQNAGASIIAQRADILDRKGRILATNLETHSLYVETAHLIDPQQTAQELAIIFPDLKPEKLVKDFTGDRKFLWIKKKISPEQMQAHPLSHNVPTLWIARGASWRPIWKPIRSTLKQRILLIRNKRPKSLQLSSQI